MAVKFIAGIIQHISFRPMDVIMVDVPEVRSSCYIKYFHSRMYAKHFYYYHGSFHTTAMQLWCGMTLMQLCKFYGAMQQSSAGTFSKISSFWVALIRTRTIVNNQISHVMSFCATQIASEVALVLTKTLWRKCKHRGTVFTKYEKALRYTHANCLIHRWRTSFRYCIWTGWIPVMRTVVKLSLAFSSMMRSCR